MHREKAAHCDKRGVRTPGGSGKREPTARGLPGLRGAGPAHSLLLPGPSTGPPPIPGLGLASATLPVWRHPVATSHPGCAAAANTTSPSISTSVSSAAMIAPDPVCPPLRSREMLRYGAGLPQEEPEVPGVRLFWAVSLAFSTAV